MENFEAEIPKRQLPHDKYNAAFVKQGSMQKGSVIEHAP